MAWVKVRDGAGVSEADLDEVCRDRIARFKRPRHWKFVDDFPLTVTGKVQKRPPPADQRAGGMDRATGSIIRVIRRALGEGSPHDSLDQTPFYRVSGCGPQSGWSARPDVVSWARPLPSASTV